MCSRSHPNHPPQPPLRQRPPPACCSLVSVRVANSWKEHVRLNPILPLLCLSLSITRSAQSSPHDPSKSSWCRNPGFALSRDCFLNYFCTHTTRECQGKWPAAGSLSNPIKGSSRLELHSVGGLCSLYFCLRNRWAPLQRFQDRDSKCKHAAAALAGEKRNPRPGGREQGSCVRVAKGDLRVCRCALSCRNALTA